MITMGKWTAIKQLNEQGYGKRAIARMLGVSRNTVKEALKQEDVPKYEHQKSSADKPSLESDKELLFLYLFFIFAYPFVLRNSSLFFP